MHEPNYASQSVPLLKRDDVDEAAGLAAVAEIAALECALAEKQRRAKAASRSNGNGNGNGGSGNGRAGGGGGVAGKRKAGEEVALGQPLDPVAAAAAAAPALVAPQPGAIVCGAPLAHPMAQPLPLVGGAGQPVAVGVPVQQAEALRQQQLQLQATILAQAQGQEEVATSAVEGGASTSLKFDDDGGCQQGSV